MNDDGEAGDGGEPTGSSSRRTPAAELDEALARARPTDPPELALAQARTARALFGTGVADGLGRFHVLERLGSGGMGVVYAAYDPELDRGVALKVVRVPAAGREAALVEAKALARLSHPNVVPVYDVGVKDDRVYIVMELVRGETLGRWGKGRARSEVLDAYRQAGSALAAAHAAGLVHRDFKPDNAIVGRDGRVRVVDFGLACKATDLSAASGQRQPVAGTPRYMAPEQAAGATVTSAADQYSFCVALANALATEVADHASAPPPRWLVAVTDRGRALEPTARFASMSDLLRALARDPARIARRRAVFGAVVGMIGMVGAAAFSLGRGHPGAAHDEVCTGGASELVATWTPDARAAALTRIAALGPYGRVLAPRLEQALQDHATRWVAGHRDACVATRRGEQSVTLLDRRMACLARGRAALLEVADIVGRAEATTLLEVLQAVRALPDPAACADIAALVSGVAPPAAALAERILRLRGQLERAQIQIAAGRSTAARAAAARCVAESRGLGYRPVLAESLLVEGHAIALDDRAAAVPVLAEASNVAMLAGADDVMVEAWARRAYAQGTESDPTGALAGLELVEAMAARASASRFARALLYNNVGNVELGRNRRDRARAAFQRALAEARGITGAGAIELLAVGSNLALVTDDPVRSDALLMDAIAELTRVLGPDHPETLRIRFIRGTTTVVPLAPAAALLTAAGEGYALHEGYSSMAVSCWAEVGYVRSELGDDAGAVDAMARAVRRGGDDAQQSPEVMPYLALWRGDPERAARQVVEALAARPAVQGEPWWQRFERAQRELVLGRARRALGDLRGARQALEASVAELEATVRDHPAAAVIRRLGRARAELAFTLAASRAREAEIASVAAAAVASLRQAEGRASEIAALDRLVVTR